MRNLKVRSLPSQLMLLQPNWKRRWSQKPGVVGFSRRETLTRTTPTSSIIRVQQNFKILLFGFMGCQLSWQSIRLLSGSAQVQSLHNPPYPCNPIGRGARFKIWKLLVQIQSGVLQRHFSLCFYRSECNIPTLRGHSSIGQSVRLARGRLGVQIPFSPLMVSEVKVVETLVCGTSNQGVQVSSDTPLWKMLLNGRQLQKENQSKVITQGFDPSIFLYHQSSIAKNKSFLTLDTGNLCQNQKMLFKYYF